MNIQIDSEEVNYLIYRYLLEAGYTHSAFVFNSESQCASTSSRTACPAGQLLSLLRKSLLYTSIELHDNLNECIAPMYLLKPHKCEKPAVQEQQSAEHSTVPSPRAPKRAAPPPPPPPPKRTAGEEAQHGDTDVAHGGSRETLHGDRVDTQAAEGNETQHTAEEERRSTPSAALPAVSSPKVNPLSGQVHGYILSGHTKSVFTCAFHPTRAVLATGAGDSTARIWDLEEHNSEHVLKTEPGAAMPICCDCSAKAVVLTHPKAEHDGTEVDNEVNVINWSPDGCCLATASGDGVVRVYRRGVLAHTLPALRTGAVLALQWSPDATRLLGGTADAAAVWNTDTGEVVESVDTHTGGVLDVCWGGVGVYALCGADAAVSVHTLGRHDATVWMRGHTKAVNAIRWNPQKTMLASASDDTTINLWRPPHPRPVHTLRDHTREVYSVCWRPSDGLQVASASFDSTARLWDVATGECVHTLRGHEKEVVAVEYSPDGEYVATAGYDKMVKIWSTKSCNLIHNLSANSRVLSISWDALGTRIACSTQDSAVCVFDLRK